MLIYALTRLRWRFGRPRVFAVVVVYRRDPLAPWRRVVAELEERIERL